MYQLGEHRYDNRAASFLLPSHSPPPPPSSPPRPRRRTPDPNPTRNSLSPKDGSP
ncbi:predicted protein [Streptomyces viridosporus ATCC 14672]|uniref:Predicted protein n=1 Tax=Streptomyces viridosporus (strain ATCC 14672 / DSM 40746 / JCM 4963 / KCTC 9882 / NRRL B-12104 / FH 1290) TaxID=566461 RepID=D5ZPI9_STRV1|nr:predicted protein [Streptomyces viridosporus ATCC 14672]